MDVLNLFDNKEIARVLIHFDSQYCLICKVFFVLIFMIVFIMDPLSHSIKMRYLAVTKSALTLHAVAASVCTQYMHDALIIYLEL